MKAKLLITYLVLLTIVVTIFWSQILLSSKAEEITIPSVQLMPGITKTAAEKMVKGASLTKEEYNALAKNKGLAVYAGSGSLMYLYEAPNKQPIMSFVAQQKSNYPLEWKINELEDNIRSLLVIDNDVRAKLDDILSEVVDLKIRVVEIEKAQLKE